MVTEVIRTIGTGGFYTTMQAWEDDAPADLVAADTLWTGELLNQAFTASGTILVISGSTSDATRYKRLRCASGASFKDHATKQANPYRWSNTVGASISAGDNGGAAIVVEEANVRLEGLMVKGNGDDGALLVTGGNCTIDQCIAEGQLALASTNNNMRARQCLFVKTTDGTSNDACVIAQSSAHFFGCTVVKPSDVGTVSRGISFEFTNANSTVKNCAVFGFTDAYGITSGGGFTVTGTTCATDDASPPSGFTTLTYNTSMFTNISNGTHDYRLPTGSALIGIGTNDATESPVDGVGTTRPQGTTLDIGSWEFVISSGLPARLVGGAQIKSLIHGSLAV